MNVKKIALNDLHESLGGKMVPFAGFNMPVRYSSDIEEHKCVREAVGVFDVSHMGEFLIQGTGAFDLIQSISSNDISQMINGQAQYACLPNEEGGIIDDFITYKLDDEKYLLVVNASNIEKDWNWINKFNKNKVQLKNISDDISLFAVQGPKAINTLQKLSSVDLSEIKYYHFIKDTIGGIDNVIISATGYTGSGGFELYVKNEFAQSLWEKIFEAGEEFGIKPIGLGARDTLRLEMGFCLYGNDIDDTTSPLEAGLGWVTKFSKEFTNSANLLKQKEEGVKRKLVGFELEDRGIPRAGYEIVDEEGKSIGKVTSGSMSPMMGKGIGLGYVQTGFHTPGSTIFIQVRNKTLQAKVVKLPIYKK
ncbi:glycine cleavage system aminomethyltransferase GcvT [Reichenbachiella sp. MALMAid0571]|uniref:glycine cleavage system aminomethyltransferase GcvT n=1 Tax=Reichenbachiella sp. MALMAid0571 TaxID=3143939 RepID=UPI0032DECE90